MHYKAGGEKLTASGDKASLGAGSSKAFWQHGNCHPRLHQISQLSAQFHSEQVEKINQGKHTLDRSLLKDKLWGLIQGFGRGEAFTANPPSVSREEEEDGGRKARRGAHTHRVCMLRQQRDTPPPSCPEPRPCGAERCAGPAAKPTSLAQVRGSAPRVYTVNLLSDSRIGPFFLHVSPAFCSGSRSSHKAAPRKHLEPLTEARAGRISCSRVTVSDRALKNQLGFQSHQLPDGVL